MAYRRKRGSRKMRRRRASMKRPRSVFKSRIGRRYGG